MKQTQLYILCGLSFAGKTTLGKALAQYLNCTRVDMDEINTARGLGLNGQAISPEEWDGTYTESYQRLDALLQAEQTVIFDAPNFTRAQRDHLRTIADRHGVDTRVIYLAVSKEEARLRWQQNRVTNQRYDVRDEDFQHLVTYFEPPTPEEQVLYYHPSRSLDEWIQQTFVSVHEYIPPLQI